MSDSVVLVHGAFHDERCWNRFVPALEARGIRGVALTLYRGGLAGDAAAVQAVVDEERAAGHRVSALGHSLGCASVAQLDPTTLHTALFLCGPLVGPGMPPATECVYPRFFELSPRVSDGERCPTPQGAIDLFYDRCADEIAAEAAAQLRPMRPYGPEPTATPLWEHVASTYVVCTQDRSVPLDYQRACAAQLAHREELDSDHSPFLGQPDALADIVKHAIADA